MKRLKEVTGEVSTKPSGIDEPNKIIRQAILVHTGPDGAPVEFQSGDGPISFDEERIQRIVKNHNQMILALAEHYGGLEKMPLGAYPPILDQHENDSTNRIGGRLASLLRFEKRAVPGVGLNCACAMADITFLGQETVEKVKDGRIYHLSIGIDEDTDTLGETSTVISPAAPGAMVLKSIHKGIQMNKLAAAKKARIAKLKGMKDDIKKMSSQLTQANNQVKLTARQGVVSARLKKLSSQLKIKPAELKKIDVKKLAKLNQEALELVLEAYENRDAYAESGQRGSTESIEFASIGQAIGQKKMKQLKKETLSDMKRLGARLKDSDDKDDDDDKKLESIDRKIEDKVEDKVEDEVKKDLEGAAFPGGELDTDEYKNNMDQLQTQVDELTTQMGRMAGIVEELMTEETAEEQVIPDETPNPEPPPDVEANPEEAAEKTEEEIKEEIKEDEQKA